MNTNETKTEKTTIDYSEVSILWGTNLGEVEAWQIARKNFNEFLDASEKEPFGKFFEKKSDKAGNSNDISTQALAWLLHTSAGNIEAKYKNAKTKQLENCASMGVPFDKQAFLEGFVCDMLAPNLAEERAKREAEMTAKRAERLALYNSVTRAIEAVKDTWADACLTPNEELVKKACIRKLEKDEPTFAKAFSVELAVGVLGYDVAKSICEELDLNVLSDGLPEIDGDGNLV